MIRVVAGRFRSRILKAPPGLTTRPTGARVRKALFDILQGELEGARVADCFAGTGALGIEALSRGAGHVDFFESEKHAAIAIRANIASLKIERESALFVGALPDVLRPGPAYDLVFLDPPWRKGFEAATVARLGAVGRLKPSVRVVIERDTRDTAVDPAIIALGLELADQRVYGDTTLCIFAVPAKTTDEGAEP